MHISIYFIFIYINVYIYIYNMWFSLINTAYMYVTLMMRAVPVDSSWSLHPTSSKDNDHRQQRNSMLESAVHKDWCPNILEEKEWRDIESNHLSSRNNH